MIIVIVTKCHIVLVLLGIVTKRHPFLVRNLERLKSSCWTLMFCLDTVTDITLEKEASTFLSWGYQ